MTARRTSPELPDNIRKRVCKACDRCRLKKSKCDDASPCGRCRLDNVVCVFAEKKAHDKIHPKGYAEMLEEQQTWLVHGLQEMYRRACDGKGWPGEPLRCEANGHPLTHDILSWLGALNPIKGERVEENPDLMQQELRRRNDVQRQDSSDARSETQSSVVASRFNSDMFASPQQQQQQQQKQQMSSTPPSFSPLSSNAQPTPKSENQNQQPLQSSYAAQTSMQGVINPVALQVSQCSKDNGFGAFDDMDLVGSTDYTKMLFDDPMSSPMFNRQIPLNCIAPASFLDTRNDYDDFNQFLNPDAMEITFI